MGEPIKNRFSFCRTRWLVNRKARLHGELSRPKTVNGIFGFSITRFFFFIFGALVFRAAAFYVVSIYVLNNEHRTHYIIIIAYPP